MEIRSVEVAIVGGGRWGKVLCRELAGIRQVRKVHLVSRRNARGMQDWLAGERLSHRVELHAKLDPVLWNTDIAAAVVANLPSEHFATARWLLENGKHVLIEKPFAATRAEAQTLIGLAESRGLVAASAFELFLASYLHNFRSVVHTRGHPHPIEQTEITWHEAAPDEGRGRARRQGASQVIADLLPHVLTLLTVLFGCHPSRAERVIATDGQAAAELELAYGPHSVRVSLSQAAAERRRAVGIRTRGGPCFDLDFTREPGVVTQDCRPLPQDHLWDALPRPVAAQMACFLDAIRERNAPLPLLARETLHIVDGTEQALASVPEPEPEPEAVARPVPACSFFPLAGAPIIAGEHR